MASIKITAPITPAWSRANARALVNARAGRRAERIAERTYRVVSSQSGDQSYTVYVKSAVGLDAVCSCPAGVSGLICWHKAAAIAAALTRCAQAQKAAAAPAPSGAEIDAKMARFARM
jgi:uncharacterized Zn finger protein